jgi:transcriptional regulator with XRE-family HTH domain
MINEIQSQMKKNRTRMNYERLRDANGGRLHDVAELAGVSVASISRIISGQTSPSVSQIQALARELGKKEGAELIADYCRDLIPNGLRRQIRIEVLSTNTRCLSPERLPGSLEFLSPRGQQMIEKLVQLLLADPELLQTFEQEINLLFDPNSAS